MTVSVDRSTWDLEALAAECVDDPLKYVMLAYPWGEPGTPLAKEPGPDTWQITVLEHLGKASRGEGKRRMAVTSGHGIGKTALTSWLVEWFMATRPHPQGQALANTKAQLDGKTWREVAKWHQLSLFRDWFEWKASKFFHKQHPATWFTAPVAWSKERPEAIAGTHEEHVLILMDEASAIPDAIHEVLEGAMTTPGAFWVMFGNPSRNTGRFKECFPGGKFSHRWQTFQVDSRTARKADQTQIAEWIQDYGEDSDFVRVRVKGQFPRTSALQFIGDDLIALAHQRFKQGIVVPREFPLVLGADIARFGDDRTVLLLRRGGQIVRQQAYRELDTMQVASLIAEWIEQAQPRAVFVDSVGLGAGVVDRLWQLGYRRQVHAVNAGEKATDSQRFYNKRMEMWHTMREWLKDFGALDPADDTLSAELLGPEYGYDAGERMQLEKKEDMKKRGLASPDCFVAGTLVRTPNGPRAIDTLTVGDLVSTPLGPRRILKVWVDETTRLTTARFSNGASLTGKGSHEIFTWDAGWVRLDALSFVNAIETDNVWRRLAWQFQSGWSTAPSCFGFKAQVAITNQTGRMRRKDFYTGASGATTMARFLRAVMSTIGTATGPITALRTWSWCPLPSTPGSIPPRGWLTQTTARAPWTDSSAPWKRPANGISPLKAWPGTASMASTPGTIGSRWRRRVSSVAGRLRAIFPPVPASVRGAVSSASAISAIKRRLARVLSVANRLCSTSIGSRPVVPVSVQTVSTPSSVPVYNLTLDADNVYYANGVLVSNCADALALSFALPVGALPPADPEPEYPALVQTYGTSWMG